MNSNRISAEWPKEELERLGYCPVCEETNRELLYDNLTDKLFGTPGKWTMYRCQKCGSGYLDPRPTPETIGKAYTVYPTHSDDKLKGVSNRSILKRTKVGIRNGYLNKKYGYKLKPSIPWGYYLMYVLPPPLRLEWDYYARHLPRAQQFYNRLLDVGCGNGAFLALARNAGWQVQGIDFDAYAAELARRKGIKIWGGDYNHAPFEKSSFDVLTVNQVIEHVHHPLHFLRTCKHWLRPGGLLWLSTPNMDSALHYRFLNNYKPLHPPQHLTLLTPSSIEMLLKCAGFTLIKQKSRGFLETHIFKQSRNLSMKSCSKKLRKKISYFEILLMSWHELLAYLRPNMASDLVYISSETPPA